ncbi:hypothetical protein F4810DRAFT_646511 [Camillea tinctor]|nr:hypothetical protein F4810DRAFT_646511 [Camillea tinctor]
MRDAVLTVTYSFKCATCKRWKPPAAFSLKQRAQWEKAKRRPNDDVTAESIGLVCKDHLNGEIEIKCAGPCGKSNAKSHFSKAQRNKPQPWCIICTDWKIRWQGNETPDVAPDEEVPDSELAGQITPYPGGSVCGTDHHCADSDDGLGINDLSDGHDTVNELEGKDNEYDHSTTIRGDYKGGEVFSVISALDSVVISHAEYHDNDNEEDEEDEDYDSDDNYDSDDGYEDVPRTISTRSIGKASSVQSSLTTKGPARYKGKATAAQLSSLCNTDYNTTYKAREYTQGSGRVDDANKLPPHLWHLKWSKDVPKTTSNASQGISSTRQSKTSTSLQDEHETLTKTTTPSECTTDTHPDLHNGAAFTPQESTFTRTTCSESQNYGSTASIDESNRDRSKNSKFFKGNTRAVFPAPRLFATRPINHSTAPTTVFEDQGYTSDSEEDF